MTVSINVNKPYTFRGGWGGSVKIQKKFHTLLTFRPDFYYFHGDFWHSKNVDVYFFFGGGGLRKCMVCHENVDIYEQPLTFLCY